MSFYTEQAVIGCLLANKNAIDLVSWLEPKHFADSTNGNIYEIIRSEMMAGHSVDEVTVLRLAQQQNLDVTLQLITSMAMSGCAVQNIERHAETILDDFSNRVTRHVCLQALQNIESGLNPKEVLANLESGLLENEAVGASDVQSLDSVLKNYLDALEQRLDGSVERISSGLADLNEKLGGGFNKGDLVIVAGRPGMGKSAFSLGVAEENESTLIVNMEMSNEQTADRFVSRAGSVNLKWLRSPNGDDDNWAKITNAIVKLQNKKIYLCDAPSQTLYAIRSKARQVKRKHGLSCVIVDYLSLMEGSENKERHLQIAEFSRGLKKLAKELDVPIIALAQLSRKCEERHDKRPIPSDLRESGQIEQDADTIIFLYRDEVYNPDSPDRGTAELILAKQRQGETGRVRVSFRGEFTRFENLAYGWQPEEQEQPKRRRLGGF